MILTGDTWDKTIGGYRGGNGKPSHWLATVSLENVDAAAKLTTANGGRVVEAPADKR